MGIIGWTVVGLITGAVFSAIRTGHGHGLRELMSIGAIGAVPGGAIATGLDYGELGTFFAPDAWLGAFLGAAVVLAVHRAFEAHEQDANAGGR